MVAWCIYHKMVSVDFVVPEMADTEGSSNRRSVKLDRDVLRMIPLNIG